MQESTRPHKDTPPSPISTYGAICPWQTTGVTEASDDLCSSLMTAPHLDLEIAPLQVREKVQEAVQHDPGLAASILRKTSLH